MILSPLPASDELQMTAREARDMGSDSLSTTFALQMSLWVGNFFSSAHFPPLATTSLLPSASSPFPFIYQQVTERRMGGQPLEQIPWEALGCGFGAGDLWMGLSDVITVMLSKHLQILLEQVQDTELGGHSPPHRETGREPSSECFLSRDAPFCQPMHLSSKKTGTGLTYSWCFNPPLYFC